MLHLRFNFNFGERTAWLIVKKKFKVLFLFITIELFRVTIEFERVEQISDVNEISFDLF